METARRKELLAAYRHRKPEKGVISFRCAATGETFLGISADTKADFNSHTFRLNMGGHPNKELQRLWKAYGAEGVIFSVVKTLKYDDPAEDYTEKLEVLRETYLKENPGAKKLWR